MMLPLQLQENSGIMVQKREGERTVEKENYTIEDLIEIVAMLRGENGCPWDKVQTHESIKKSMIEETYEAIDALDHGDDAMFANELGDVLLQVVFHAQIAGERGAFDFTTVVNEICNKLISRHTHVFGADRAVSAEQALGNWEKNKKKEKNLETYAALLEEVPHHLPALMRAEKVQKKAASAGFDWKDASGVCDKIAEEANELVQAQNEGTEAQVEEEFGDLLFSVVNLGRFLKITPEISLANATDKFIRRFGKMEQLAQRELTELDATQLDALWEKAKKSE